MVGYLLHLRERMAKAIGQQGWALPIISLGLAPDDRPDWEHDLHAKGVSARLSLAGMNIEKKDVLHKLLQQDYYFDRIYLRSSKKVHHFTLNPRFGHEFLELYKTKSGLTGART